MRAPQENTIRDGLRATTREAHDALDLSMSRLDLADPEDYACFLAIQLAAREPVEAWCAAHCTPDLRPPAQASLIRADLVELGRNAPPASSPPKYLPHDLEPLAVAWVMAGSSLGNRTLLARMRKAGASGMPTDFLDDPAMTNFWQGLKPKLDRPAAPGESDRMAESARTIFALFAQEAALLDEAIAA